MRWGDKKGSAEKVKDFKEVSRGLSKHSKPAVDFSGRRQRLNFSQDKYYLQKFHRETSNKNLVTWIFNADPFAFYLAWK